jgi:putative aldouronate transport system substrate-binding protein
MSEHTLSRRGLLLGAAGLVALGAVGCGSDSDEPSSGGDTSGSTGSGSGGGAGNSSASGPSGAGTSTGGSKTLPAYVPFPGLSPDLPEQDNVPAAFFSYPKNPSTFAKVPIAKGDSISVLTPTNGVGTPKGSSAWWQNLQDVLGIDLSMNMVPGADLGTKQQAMLSSGDIPDIAIVNPNNVPLGALQKYFTDLGPYLSGDAVKEYPALAAIPSLAWKTPTIGGTLFGVPQPRIAASYTLGVRQDLLDEKGVKADISTGQDLLDLYKELTDSKNSHWAYGQDPMWLLRLVLEMHGVPNGANPWIEDNGKFTAMYEAEGTKDSLDIVAGVWKAGYMHPDSAAPNAAWFPGGTISTYIADFSQFPNLMVGNPGIKIGLVPAPKWDGGGLAVKQLNAGASGNYAAFKRADDAKIKMLLQFANYLAAPVGTQEFLTANYGKEGVSYTFTGDDPQLTDSGNADHYSAQALGYVANGSLDVLYTPGQSDFVKQQHDFLTKVMPQTYFNPTIGLYSPTNVGAAGLTATKNITDIMSDIMFGRKPASAWDAAVKTWQKAAGDKMRAEYEEAFAKVN